MKSKTPLKPRYPTGALSATRDSKLNGAEYPESSATTPSATRKECGFFKDPICKNRSEACEDCPLVKFWDPAAKEAEESKSATLKPIPIKVAEKIGADYGYDQVIILVRSVGQGGGETLVTYGKDRTHCEIAAKVGEFLRRKVLGWHGKDKDASR